MLITAEHIHKNYGLKQILSDVSIYVDSGDKIGVLGINGTGKSTLLRILAGREEADSGTVSHIGNVQVSFLEQDPPMSYENDLIQQVFVSMSESYRQLNEYEACSILNKLGFTDTSIKIGTLSGGQRKRVALAAALLHPADVLILDEPTNHLDIDMINWLEERLSRFTGALIMVTHDRYFLNRVVNKITELERGAFYSYEANYTKYLEFKALRTETQQAEFRKRSVFLRKEYEWISRGVKARGTKSKDRIERYENLKNMSGLEKDGLVEISAASARLGKKIIEIKNIRKTFGTKTVLNSFTYNILKDDRIGLVGINGAGKSTLLNIIAGRLSPDSGIVNIGATVRIGYFTQENSMLPENEKAIDYLNDIAREVHTSKGTFTASRMMEQFLFTGEMQHSLISRLSGGEKRRLYLLGILMATPNVLLLDEPTNDLDIDTLGILEEFIQGFDGPVISVSHDRYFLDKTATSIFEICPDGDVKCYTGNYSDFEAKRIKDDLVKPSGKTRPEIKNSRFVRQQKLKFTYKEEQEFKTINEDISALENEISLCEDELVAAASDYVLLSELTAKKQELEEALAGKMERWLYLNDLDERIKNMN